MILAAVRIFFPNIQLNKINLPINKKVVASPIASPNKTNEIEIIIDFQDKKISEQAIGYTAYDVLKKTLDKKNIEIKVKEYDFGLFIEQIGDYKNTKDLSWIYYVNNQAGDVASDKKEVKAGDKVEWKYEKPNF